MHAVDLYIQAHPGLAWLVLLAAFVILAKSADVFVEGAVGLAYRFNVPKLVVGIVLVSFATTVPELSVSLLAAVRGNPEIALGNAVGSVICNAGLALAFAGLLAVAAIPVLPRVLKTSGAFLVGIGVLAFLFCLPDNTMNRWEGIILVILFFSYLSFLLREHKRGRLRGDVDAPEPDAYEQMALGRMIAFFALGLFGILLASEFIVSSATSIARWLSIPESVIALTLVALGTSIPEVATCISSARKGHGDIAVGNIIGANIMNICWVAGASSVVNNLTLGRREVMFMFPAMFVMVGAMLVLLRRGHNLTKRDAAIMLALYVIYLITLVILFPPTPQGSA